MKNNFIYFFCIAMLWHVFSASAAEKLKMEMQPDGLYVNNTSVKVLQKIYHDFGYKDFVVKNRRIPAIFAESMPLDFDRMKNKTERNRLFIKIMAPLTLKVNEEIILERGRIAEIKKDLDENKELQTEQKDEIEKLAIKYDVFTRMKDRERYAILIRDLIVKVDKIAPSLLIAVAAAESNWGTAEEVNEGNALYKLKDWFTDKGIKPKGEDDDSYRIRKYPDLLSAVRDYALKLNSDVNFQHMWIARAQIRDHNQILKGRTTVYGMVLGSPLENYAGLINYIMTFYDMVNIDETQLESISFEEK